MSRPRRRRSLRSAWEEELLGRVVRAGDDCHDLTSVLACHRMSEELVPAAAEIGQHYGFRPGVGRGHPHALLQILAEGLHLVGHLVLGHESVETTYIYLHADLKLKEAALAKTTPTQGTPDRYHPDDEVLAFLNGL